MLDAKDSKSFQFRAFAICSISHPERRAKIAVFILSTSENNIVLSGEIIPIEFRTRNLRRSLATSKLLMSDMNLNWLRVFFPETAGIAFKIKSGCKKDYQHWVL